MVDAANSVKTAMSEEASTRFNTTQAMLADRIKNISKGVQRIRDSVPPPVMQIAQTHAPLAGVASVAEKAIPPKLRDALNQLRTEWNQPKSTSDTLVLPPAPKDVNKQLTPN